MKYAIAFITCLACLIGLRFTMQFSLDHTPFVVLYSNAFPNTDTEAVACSTSEMSLIRVTAAAKMLAALVWMSLFTHPIQGVEILGYISLLSFSLFVASGLLHDLWCDISQGNLHALRLCLLITGVVSLPVLAPVILSLSSLMNEDHVLGFVFNLVFSVALWLSLAMAWCSYGIPLAAGAVILVLAAGCGTSLTATIAAILTGLLMKVSADTAILNRSSA